MEHNIFKFVLLVALVECLLFTGISWRCQNQVKVGWEGSNVGVKIPPKVFISLHHLLLAKKNHTETCLWPLDVDHVLLGILRFMAHCHSPRARSSLRWHFPFQEARNSPYELETNGGNGEIQFASFASLSLETSVIIR